MAVSVKVLDIESRSINRALKTNDYQEDTFKPWYTTVPRATDEIENHTWCRITFIWWHGPAQTTINKVGIGKLLCVNWLCIRPRKGVTCRGWYYYQWSKHIHYWWLITGISKWWYTSWWDIWRIHTRQDRFGLDYGQLYSCWDTRRCWCWLSLQNMEDQH